MSKPPTLLGPERFFTYDEALRIVLSPPPTGARASSDFIRGVLWLTTYCNDDESRARKLVKSGGEEALMKLVEGANTAFAEIGAVGLGRIWRIAKPSIDVVRGYVPRFVACFRRHDGNADTMAGWANALAEISEELVGVGGDGFVEICKGLVLLLQRHPGHKEVAENCAACVGNIALKYREAAAACFPVPGAPRAVLGALRGNLKRRDGAAKMLQVVTLLQLDGADLLGIARGLLGAVCAAYRAHSRDSDVAMLSAMVYADCSRTPQCLRIMVRLGIAEELMALLRAHHAAGHTAECGILALGPMACYDGNLPMLLRNGAIDAACAVLRSNPGRENCAEYACMLLKPLAALPAGRARIMASDAPALIAAALRKHAAVADVAAQACSALRNLAADPANRAPLMKLGAAWGIISCLRSCSSSEEVVWAAMGALFGLVCAPENRADLYRLGIAALTVATLERWSESMSIAWACCGVLLRLSQDKALCPQLKQKDLGVLKAIGPIISGLYDAAGPVGKAALALRANLREAALPAAGS